MLNLTQIFLVFLSALTVIVGDSIIKKISAGTITQTLKDPLMLTVYVLYFAQIVFAIYIFLYKGELAIYANYYIIFYSILGILSGVLFFKEHLNAVQLVGIGLAMVAAVLMNYTK
jgi:drug/metabolite transporter (DMT)-like permease